MIDLKKSDLKVLETIDSYLPSIDGPINVVKNYSTLLNRKAHCVLAVPKAAKKDGYKDNEEFTVIRCRSVAAPEKYRAARPACDFKFKKLIKSQGFDIVHAHSPFMLSKCLYNIAKKQNIPFVITIHTQYKEDFKRATHNNKLFVAIAMKYMMHVVNKADAVWTVNNASREILRSYGYKGNIDVIRNGTDFDYPENSEELVKHVNDAHGLHGQKNVFIFVGRIALYKNLPLLAQALKLLKESGEDFRMLIVGGGFDEEEFKKIVEHNGLSDKFIFVGKISDRKVLQGYYLRSDLFLFPSTFDTSSLVPIEAAAHKLPTLLIKGSYTAENITDNVNGFLAEETPEDYYKRIKEIISEDGLMQKVGEEAHRSVYRSWDTVTDEVLQKYKDVIAEYRKTHGDKRPT